MSGDPRPRPSIPRRAFLELLASAPCAVAACATPARAPPAAAGGARAAPAPSDPAAGPAEDAAIAAVRALPLPPDAEPACVFRAAAAHPGTTR